MGYRVTIFISDKMKERGFVLRNGCHFGTEPKAPKNLSTKVTESIS